MKQEQMRKSLCRQAGKELRRLERQIREKETGGACVRNRTDREQIRFYSGILNYLKNDEEPIPAGCLSALSNEPRPVFALWSLYRKSRTLDYSSAEKIREILEDFLYYNAVCIAA